jgi:hypothetical protein
LSVLGLISNFESVVDAVDPVKGHARELASEIDVRAKKSETFDIKIVLEEKVVVKHKCLELSGFIVRNDNV